MTRIKRSISPAENDLFFNNFNNEKFILLMKLLMLMKFILLELLTIGIDRLLFLSDTFVRDDSLSLRRHA